MNAGAEEAANRPAGPTERAERMSGAILGRVEMLTLLLGAAGAVWAAERWGWRGAAGLAVGTALSWLNFRWLKGSVRAFGSAAGAAGMATNAGAAAAAPARVGKGAYFQFIGRYVLLLGGVYVILTRTSLPAVSIFVGLFTVAAGVVVGIVYELLASAVRQVVRGES